MKQIFLTTILCLSMAISGFAQSGTTGNLSWGISDGTLTISGTGAMPDYGYSIGDSPWRSNSYIKSVIVLEGVTSIGSYAFDNCSSLASITIPNSVTSIEYAAFSNCGLTSITIPDGVTWIGEHIFSNCRDLTSIEVNSGNSKYKSEDGVLFNKAMTTLIKCPAKKQGGYIIPDGVISIEGNAFYGCADLTSVIIPNSLKNIGAQSFAYCRGLTSITIGNEVTSIEDSAFKGCTGLTNVTIPNSVTSIRNEAFEGCTGLISITISNNVTIIRERVFYGCTSLASITIPEGVTSIGNSAFYACSGLTSITIPESVTSIGSSTFYGCTSLMSIIIPSSVTSIEYNTFQNCRNLISITIPENVTSIRWGAFSGCRNLEHIYVSRALPPSAGETDSFKDVDLTSCILHVPVGSKEAYKQASTWKDFLIILDDIQKEVVLKTMSVSCGTGGSVKVNNESITSKDYEEGTSITITVTPNSGYQVASFVVNDVEKSLVNNTYTIASLEENTSIAVTFSEVLDGTPIEGTNLRWKIEGTTLYILGTGAMPDYSYDTPWYGRRESIQTAVIAEGVTTIGWHAFSDCTGLVSISIPNSVTNIGQYAFSSCNSLSLIEVSSGNNNYITKDGVLFNKAMTSLLVCPATKRGQYTIPNGVKTIEGSAFGNSDLTSITIPNSVTSIGGWAFSGCSNLTSITIPEGVTSIGYATFQSCINLTSISIPNGVTSIGYATFSNCQSLTSITIPSSVTNIERYAFLGCKNLTRIALQSLVPPTTEEDIFFNVNIEACILEVPYGSVNAYKAAECWKDFNIFALPSSVIVEEPQPIEENGKGSIDVSFVLPGDFSITGSFRIELPAGYTLDEATTVLSETLAGLFKLIITAAGNNTWHIEIAPKNIRSSHALTDYTKVMSVGYIVDQSVANGNYEIELKDIDMQLEDGTPIEQESITVTTEVRRVGASIPPTEASSIRVYSTAGNIVVENAPLGETIHIYNVSGALVAKTTETIVAVPQGMYVVKVGKANFKVTSNK